MVRISTLSPYFIAICLSVLYFAFPFVAGAQAPLVTCTGVDCNLCTFVEMVNRITVWLIAILTLVAVMLMVYAGFRMVISAGNTQAVQDAKKLLINVIIGFIIVLAAYALVDTLLKALIGDTARVGQFWSPAGEACGRVFTPGDQTASFYTPDLENTTNVGVAGAGGAGSFGGSYVPTRISPAGQICFNGADGAPNTSDDVCVNAQNVSGGAYSIPAGAPAGYSSPGAYIGPDVIAANPQISPNFRLCDVTNCNESQRAGDYVYIDPFAVAQLENVQSTLGSGVQINSGYRSPAYNQSVDGATHSRHMYGDAFDIAVTSQNTESEIVAACRAAGATNVYTYGSGAHVHCDWRGASRPAPTSLGL